MEDIYSSINWYGFKNQYHTWLFEKWKRRKGLIKVILVFLQRPKKVKQNLGKIEVSLNFLSYLY